MIIRNESERRRAEEQIEYLRSELEKMPTGEQQDEVSRSVMSGLRMQISDIENKLTEYERLKKGLPSPLTADSFDDIGELIIKARIARGWSQADLAEALDMKQQQVQRYERNDWQKISLWRLQEAVEALDLEVSIRAWPHSHGAKHGELPQITVDHEALLHSTLRVNEGINITLEPHVGIVYGSSQMLPGAPYEPWQTTPGIAQDAVREMLLTWSQIHGEQANAPKEPEYRSPKSQRGPAAQNYAA